MNIETEIGRIRPVALRVLLRNRVDLDEAEDIVQEASIKALKHGSGLRDQKAFGTWFIQVCKRVLVDKIRVRTARRTMAIEDVSVLPMANTRALDNIEADQLARDLIEASPNPEVMETLIRFVADGGMYEASDAMGVCVNTVKTRCFRAKRWAQQELRT